MSWWQTTYFHVAKYFENLNDEEIAAISTCNRLLENACHIVGMEHYISCDFRKEYMYKPIHSEIWSITELERRKVIHSIHSDLIKPDDIHNFGISLAKTDFSQYSEDRSIAIVNAFILAMAKGKTHNTI